MGRISLSDLIQQIEDGFFDIEFKKIIDDWDKERKRCRNWKSIMDSEKTYPN